MHFHLHSRAILLLFAISSTRAWDFEIFEEEGCGGISIDSYSGTGDKQCKKITNEHKCFRIGNLGTLCELFLHKDQDDCEAGEAEASYGQGADENTDITPHFTWDSWSILC